jgi:ABC-2 type transport system ATP-binding protein
MWSARSPRFANSTWSADIVYDDEVVRVRGLTKGFPTDVSFVSWLMRRGSRRPVLRGVDFSIRRGELFGLLGANGAGKSTVLRVLVGLVVPEAGSVEIEGIDALAMPLAARRAVGFCAAEERSFYFRLSARHNLEYFGALVGLKGAELHDRVESVARTVDLFHDLDRRFDGLSSGMRQRLAIARAMLGDPDVLILDEPTRALDPTHAAEIRTFIREELVERRGKTVLLATNQLDEAWQLCDRIAVLRDGRVVAVAPPSELTKGPAGLLRYAITVDRTDEALLARTRAVSGLRDLRVAADGSAVCLYAELDRGATALTELLRAVSANGISVISVRPEEPAAADVFADLVSAAHDRT